MEYGFGTEGYYKKMLELQDKLRKSEEERLILEEKFNEMMQLTRDAEYDRLRLMRHRYHKFLEEDKVRQERNELILQTLDKIESRAKMLSAKTERFKAFRKQYEAYIKRIYRLNPEQFSSSKNYVPPERGFARKKLFSDLPENTETVEGKLAMLEQYLRDNFDNFPPELTAKTPINNNRIFEERNVPRNGFYNHNGFDKLENESEESEYNKYPRKKYEKPDMQNILSPKKNELLGNTIEKELERLQNKEPVKHLQRDNSIESKSPERVIQDYKELVTKSEEKFGLRGESPIRKTSPIEQTPIIYDNTTKLLNVEELKNITENNVLKITPTPQENIDSESENPVIKNYKKMLKTLQDEVPPKENDLNINDPQISPNIIKDNITSEQSKQEDISDRTEAPEDISLNLSSEPIEIIPKPQNLIENVDNDISVDESTIKEQLANKQKSSDVLINSQDENSNVFKTESIQNNPAEISEQVLTQEYVKEQQNYSVENFPQETSENQHVYQEYDASEQNIASEGFDQQQYEPQYDVQQQPEYQQAQNQPEYQQAQDQPEYQEEYNQSNVENQPVYQEGYDQPNIPDSNYPEGYDVTQQNQQSFPEGLDQSQPEYQQEYDPNQVGYDPQYYEQQNTSDQQYTTEQQPVYEEGYDQQQYDASQYSADQQYAQDQQYATDQQYPADQQYPVDQQYPTDQQYPADQEYPVDQQYPADQHYQEYPDQQYQPEQYEQQQYSEEQSHENVYSTQQEYLEGEQNIDKQYESEQNVQYEQEQYPEGYVENVQQQQIVGEEQQNTNSEITEQSITQSEVDNKPIVEKKLPNLANLLDTDTESIKQDSKVSNESDFDFSKS